MTARTFDVAVVGGGVVGLLASRLFAADGLNVALIAPGLDVTPPVGPAETRSYAITPGARAVLEAAGAWQVVDAGRCGHFSCMEVWDASSAGRVRFDPPVTAPAPMGHIVEHRNLVAALGAALANCERTTVYASPLVRLGDGPVRHMVLSDGTDLEARLVAGADGADSQVRASLGIDVERREFGQAAVVCNVVTSAPHGHCARQRFLASGPLAFLPLPDAHECAIVWTVTPDLAAAIAADSGAAFRARLADAIGGVMGTVTDAGARAEIPLHGLRAGRMQDAGAALLGDAAHVVHPLAGQGLNLGILDAASLVECLGRPADRPDWPRRRDLLRYERWRRSEALAMAFVTDVLKRLFEREEMPVRWLRGAGMRVTDGIVPLKRWLIARAMGIEGDLPRLARRHAS